jgi:hypothetical protein
MPAVTCQLEVHRRRHWRRSATFCSHCVRSSCCVLRGSFRSSAIEIATCTSMPDLILRSYAVAVPSEVTLLKTDGNGRLQVLDVAHPLCHISHSSFRSHCLTCDIASFAQQPTIVKPPWSCCPARVPSKQECRCRRRLSKTVFEL